MRTASYIIGALVAVQLVVAHPTGAWGGQTSSGQNMFMEMIKNMFMQNHMSGGQQWGGSMMGGQNMMGGNQWGGQQQMGGNFMNMLMSQMFANKGNQMGGQMGGQWPMNGQMGGQMGQWAGQMQNGGQMNQAENLMKIMFMFHSIMEARKSEQEKGDMMMQLGGMISGHQDKDWEEMVWNLLTKMMQMKAEKKDDELSFEEVIERLMAMKDGGDDKTMSGISKEDLQKWKMWKEMEDVQKLAEFVTKYQNYQEKNNHFKEAMETICFVITARSENARSTGTPLFTRTTDTTLDELKKQLDGASEEEIKAVINNMYRTEQDKYNEVFFRLVMKSCVAGHELEMVVKEMEAMKAAHMAGNDQPAYV